MYADFHSQFETFDVRSAAISVESDRRFIFDSIEEMFDGSLDNFNNKVRTTIKSAALQSLTGQRAKLPYWVMLWQGLFDMPSFFSEWTSTELVKETPYVLVARCVFGVTNVFCISPLLYGAAMELGSRWGRGVRPGIACALLKDLVVGVLIAALFVAWDRLDDLLQDLSRFGAEEWQAMLATVLVNGLAWIATLWAFRPWPRRGRTQCSQRVLGERLGLDCDIVGLSAMAKARAHAVLAKSAGASHGRRFHIGRRKATQTRMQSLNIINFRVGTQCVPLASHSNGDPAIGALQSQ
eukprot:CAMPEP_0198610626 /NCGR_PEP_ID=MMETSP1462-20131121/156986_1 /TAXON_ID=1333877 /ORGANISM="Brandtodinium nutriculum, Strain RCC3387" /LENGTH=294 /DNA_ID=CAMNT_0044342431 /DNA_START=181 /DNA_END=1065 /DNA_ORIENTATION=+